jgi:diguanylate cyclase (GGDEF)-like protein/putative nucleotidyltransferase with HDIG domain
LNTKALSELARLAVGASTAAPAGDTLVRAMELVRSQTGALAVLLFYGSDGGFVGCGVGDEPGNYPESALSNLQQRLVHFRVPLAFNLSDGQVQFITRAENKQPRDYMAWPVPTPDSWTEFLILRGTWPTTAVVPLLEFMGSAMPAITIMLERFVGVGRRQRLEHQLDSIGKSTDILRRSAEVLGSVAAAYPKLHGVPRDQVEVLKALAEAGTEAVAEVRANRDLMEAHLRLQEYAARLEQAVQREREHAATDALTGLVNHRGALQVLQLYAEGETPVSLLVADIDGFKLFNDTYGHVMGDEVLKLVAKIWRKASESGGTAARYGGDEFLMILPNKTRDEATELAREIAAELEKTEFQTESDTLVPIAISIGVASFPDDASSISKLLAVADSAMYEAKKRLRGTERHAITTATEDTTFGLLESLVLAVDAKDRYTREHSSIVADYTLKLAERLNLSEESRRALRTAGLLHDIGKIAVPDEILKKPAALTIEEYEVMKSHVRIGEMLIRELPQLKDVVQGVACHHERFDGTGYPRGLKGEEIPLVGRIMAIADAYSAMCLDRPYRKGMAHDRIVEDMMAGSGLQFDPEILAVFVDLLLEEQLSERQVA